MRRSSRPAWPTRASAIVATIVLFQFVAMQILAVIMLSNAISDEVYHRTLGLLMTTPISSLQIVLGKVLSRLLQLILLLAISLPILAIARVLGGVSWSYLLSSLCVTLTTAIFAGSLSLLFSVKNRFAYGVITRTMFTLGCLYLLLLPPLIGQASSLLLGPWRDRRSRAAGGSAGLLLVSISPLSSMLELTRQLFYGGLHTPSQFSLPLHCVVMLGLSALVLTWAVAVVRKVALRQATGQLDAWFKPRKRRRKDSASVAADAGDDVRGAIKRVQGPPVVWRELRAPFIHGVDNRNSYIGLAATVAALFVHLSGLLAGPVFSTKVSCMCPTCCSLSSWASSSTRSSPPRGSRRRRSRSPGCCCWRRP